MGMIYNIRAVFRSNKWDWLGEALPGGQGFKDKRDKVLKIKILEKRTFEFAVAILDIIDLLPKSTKGKIKNWKLLIKNPLNAV